MLHTIISFVGRVAGFSASGFFSGSPSPGPLGVPLGPSWTFSGVCGDIRGLGCAAGVGGAGGGFAAGVGCTGGVFAIGVGGICLKLNFAAVAVGVVDAGECGTRPPHGDGAGCGLNCSAKCLGFRPPGELGGKLHETDPARAEQRLEGRASCLW